MKKPSTQNAPARTVGRTCDGSYPVGLRAEAPEECGPVTESIDLEGFQWYGITRDSRRNRRRTPPPTIRLNGKGMFRLSAALTEAVEATLRPGERARIMIGVAPRALALRIVSADDPNGSLLRFHGKPGAGRYGLLTSSGAQLAVGDQGVALPITLDAVFHPDQRLIYAKLPKPERGRGR